MKIQHLSWPIAALLAIYAIDLPKILIDVLALPIPRLWGYMPYLAPFVAVAGAALASLGPHRRSEGFLRIHDLMLLLVLGIWTSIELFHRLDGRLTNFSLVLDQLWFFVAYFTTRLHLSLLGDTEHLIRIVNRLVTAVLVTHLALLIVHQLGIGVPGLATAELVERNGISLLGVLLIFLRWFLRDKRHSLWKDLSSPTTLVVVAQTWANHARGASILLLLLIAVRVLLALRAKPPVIVALLLSFTLGLSAVAVFGYRVLSGVGILPSLAPDTEATRYDNLLREESMSDTRRSAAYRLAANTFTGQAFVHNPVLGVGTDQAMRVRVGGYMSHTYYLVLASALGLIGLAPYLGWLALFFYSTGKNHAVACGTAASLWWCSITFVNDLLPWYGLLFAVLVIRFGSESGSATSSQSGRVHLPHVADRP